MGAPRRRRFPRGIPAGCTIGGEGSARGDRKATAFALGSSCLQEPFFVELPKQARRHRCWALATLTALCWRDVRHVEAVKCLLLLLRRLMQSAQPCRGRWQVSVCPQRSSLPAPTAASCTTEPGCVGLGRDVKGRG
ncbi:hypothetical protein MRX96_012578 [Rhipicephalus microplus]